MSSITNGQPCLKPWLTIFLSITSPIMAKNVVPLELSFRLLLGKCDYVYMLYVLSPNELLKMAFL